MKETEKETIERYSKVCDRIAELNSRIVALTKESERITERINQDSEELKYLKENYTKEIIEKGAEATDTSIDSYKGFSVERLVRIHLDFVATQGYVFRAFGKRSREYISLEACHKAIDIYIEDIKMLEI